MIEAAGFGDRFVHRTGHSIDRDLHGSGPHLDDYETHDDRRLIPGIGFSVEPGIYLPGEFGVRSEVNMYWGGDGAGGHAARAAAGADHRVGLGNRGRGGRPLPKSRSDDVRIASVYFLYQSEYTAPPPCCLRARDGFSVASAHRTSRRARRARRLHGCFNRQLSRFQRVTRAVRDGRARVTFA